MNKKREEEIKFTVLKWLLQTLTEIFLMMAEEVLSVSFCRGYLVHITDVTRFFVG